MIEYLSIDQVLDLHRRQLRAFGGASGLRDRGALKAAVARSQETFGGEDLYPDVVTKAAALMHALVMNHPFVDGNKRVGAHAGIVFLVINDVEPDFSSAELTEVTLRVARGELSAEALAIWLRQRSRQRTS
ncbi:MAG: type II toxin-antitoxin system death-on-curing family toxin [Deltaproteobacteria bacterium]|nr:type II toxin-antitoxin system death-on-curing family toxin [Deltaproteobacteria bacterium]